MSQTTKDTKTIVALAKHLQRAVTLLQAAADIVENTEGDAALEATAEWDGTECDGMCLLDDINVLFEEMKADGLGV